MATLAFHSAYAGGTNAPAIALAERLSAIAYPSINTFFFTSGGAESTETSFKTARFYWKALGKPDKVKVICAPPRLSRPDPGGDERDRADRCSGRCSSRGCRASATSTRPIRIASSTPIRR